MPGPVDRARLLVCELVPGAFEGVSGMIRPDWSVAREARREAEPAPFAVGDRVLLRNPCFTRIHALRL